MTITEFLNDPINSIAITTGCVVFLAYGVLSLTSTTRFF